MRRNPITLEPGAVNSTPPPEKVRQWSWPSLIERMTADDGTVLERDAEPAEVAASAAVVITGA